MALFFGAKLAWAMDGGKRAFWGVPKSITSVYQQFNRSGHIKVSGALSRPADVMALSGFSEILSEMQNRCNGGASLFSPLFEQEFLAQVPDRINPAVLNPVKISDLRSKYYTAFKTLAEISAAKTQLAELLAKYQTQIDELNVNRAAADQIQNIQLPQAQSDLNKALAQQTDAKSELEKIEALIPRLTAKIKDSQQILDEAKAQVAPLQPEHDRIVQNLMSAQSSLSQAQSRLDFIEMRLRDSAEKIISLRSEADSIERFLPQLSNDLDRALAIYRDAQNRRSQFNEVWERDRRLRNNFEYARLHNDHNQMQHNLRQAKSDTQRLRVERDRVARDLQICRSQPIITDTQKLVLTPESAEPPLKPGPPQRPEPPPQRPNCSHLENALHVANSNVAQSEANQRNIVNRINEINSRIMQIERQTDSDVRYEYNLLVEREDQSRREHERISRELSSAQSRLAQIQNSEIPNLENEQRNLSNERPSVIAGISQAQSDVNRHSQELAQFESANDWGQKVANVDSASSQLQGDQAQLNSVLSRKQLEQQKLDLNIALAQQAQNKINSLTEQLTALNNRAAELNEVLKNLPTERAPIDAKITSLQTELANLKTTFLGLLN